MADVHECAKEWINQLSIDDGNDSVHVSFSAFHSKQQTVNIIPQTSSHLLPLLNQPVQPHATVRHCAKLVKYITDK